MSADLVPYTAGMSLQDVSGDAAGAMAVLCGTAARIQALNRANVFYRFVLGRQLAEIRDRQLWKEIFTGEPVPTWDEWLQVTFCEITGFSDGTGYGALKLAASPALGQLDEDGLKRFNNLYNPLMLVRAEANGLHVTPELLEAAMVEPVKRFRAIMGFSESQGRVEHVVDDPETASDLQAIICLLKLCRREHIQHLRSRLCDTLMRMAGGNPNDVIEAVLAAIDNEITSQVEQQPEVYGDLGREEVEDFHKE